MENSSKRGIIWSFLTFGFRVVKSKVYLLGWLAFLIYKWNTDYEHVVGYFTLFIAVSIFIVMAPFNFFSGPAKQAGRKTH